MLLCQVAFFGQKSPLSKTLQKGSKLNFEKSEVIRFVLRSLLFLPMCLGFHKSEENGSLSSTFETNYLTKKFDLRI